MTSLVRFAIVLVALSVLGAGCDSPVPPMRDAGMDSGVELDAGFVYPDGTVFCETDADCDDGVECTIDTCLPHGVCNNAPDASFCDDGVFCNGREVCDRKQGCLPAPVRETCNDQDVCTIDRCNEELQRCEHFPRDLDGDGDVDFFCGGGDCDDRDPLVSSLRPEVCGDHIDNDCDGEIDEADCGGPPHDTCSDPLDVSAGGVFSIDSSGAGADHPSSCGGSGRRDVVASFTLSEPRSVSIAAQGDLFAVYLSLRTECAEPGSELDCRSGYPGVLRRRVLEPGTYFLVISGSSGGEIELNVRFGEPMEPVENATCATPTVITPDGSAVEGSFVEVDDDASLSCHPGGSPDLFYTFETSEEYDVEITARSSSGDSLAWALRTSCEDEASTLRCAYGAPATGRIHQLPPGTYFLVVEGPSWEEVDFTIDVRLLPPTSAPPGDTCSEPLLLPIGSTVTGSFGAMEADIGLSCGFYDRDVVYEFSLDEDSDVTVELETSGRRALAVGTSCGASGHLHCSTASPSRAHFFNLAAGTYYVVAEGRGGYSLRVDATTPPTIPVDVSGNDDCTMAYEIPEEGGLFRGVTTGMNNTFATASCQTTSGPDVAFRLVLSSTKRVILSTEHSSFDTILHVHRESCLAGSDIACDDDGGVGRTSLIDRVFDAGTYYIIVDGWSSGHGEYFLDVSVSDP